METFCLFNTLIPGNLIKHCDWDFIGSRTHTYAGKESDYDVMFRSEHRTAVLAHLRNLGVEYEGGQDGPIKFKVCTVVPMVKGYIGVSHSAEMEFNFCFIKDFEAWQKATDVMRKITLDTPRSSLAVLDKRTRVAMFENLVIAFGGSRPVLPNRCSSPV
jgi:hypothetical protein